MLRTFQVYAGLTFLGYEYAVDREEANAKTHKKFGVPTNWGVDSYTVNKIIWAEEKAYYA